MSARPCLKEKGDECTAVTLTVSKVEHGLHLRNCHMTLRATKGENCTSKFLLTSFGGMQGNFVFFLWESNKRVNGWHFFV